jgi:hypothetical protein
MTPDMWLTLGGILITSSLAAFVSIRGFTIDSIPLFLVSAKLPKPIVVRPQGTWCGGLALMLFVTGGAGIGWGYYQKWIGATGFSANPLPLDRHFKLIKPGWTLQCESANVSNPQFEANEYVFIWVNSVSRNEGVAFLAQLNVSEVVLSAPPKFGPEDKQYNTCVIFRPEERKEGLSLTISQVFGAKRPGAPCYVSYEYVNDVKVIYNNYFGANIERIFRLDYNSNRDSVEFDEIHEDKTLRPAPNMTLDIEEHYESSPPQKYTMQSSAALRDKVITALRNCEKGTL